MAHINTSPTYGGPTRAGGEHILWYAESFSRPKVIGEVYQSNGKWMGNTEQGGSIWDINTYDTKDAAALAVAKFLGYC